MHILLFFSFIFLSFSTPPQENFSIISANDDGQYVYALANKCIYKSNNYGTDFSISICTNTLINTTNLISLFTESTGQYVTISLVDEERYIFISDDYGESFTMSSFVFPSSYNINNNGRICMLNTENNFLISNDSGYTWLNLNNNVNLTISSLLPISLSMFYAVRDNLLYTVEINNNNLEIKNITKFNFDIVAGSTSLNGQYIYIAYYNVKNNLFFISSSSDYAQTFTSLSISAFTNKFLLEGSSNGKYLYLQLYYGDSINGYTVNILYSTDYGKTFKGSEDTFNNILYIDIGMSMSGNYFYFLDNGIYSSVNYGENFFIMGSDCTKQKDCNYYSTCNQIGTYDVKYGGVCSICPFPFAMNVNSPEIIENDENVSYCTSINLRAENYGIYVIFSIIFSFSIFLIYMTRLQSQKDILFFVLIPISDSLITIIYILYITFNNVYIFSFFLFFSFSTSLHFFHYLKKKGIYPYFYVIKLDERIIKYVEEEHKIYMERSDSPDLHTKLYHLFFYSMKLFYFFLLSFPQILLNSIIFIPLFIVGFILFETKTFFIKPIYNKFITLWTNSDKFIIDKEIDVGRYNESIIMGLIISSIPKLIIQIVNARENKSITYVTIIAVIISCLQFVSTLYTFTYHFILKKRKLSSIPIELSTFSKTKSESICGNNFENNCENKVKSICESKVEINPMLEIETLKKENKELKEKIIILENNV
jgi:hypothetical protein